MVISLLFDKEANSDTKPLEKKILYHLSIDRSFSYICADVKKRERFLSVIATLTGDKEEIRYRQDIIRDFRNHPSLIAQLISMVARFEELKVSQKRAGKDEYSLHIAGNSSSEASKNILQAQALCLKRALLFVKGFGELLAKYELKSNGLKHFYNVCRELYENPEFSRLLTFCSKYENISANKLLDFRFAFNENGAISEYDLIDHRYIHVTDHELKKKGFSFFKKNEETSYPCVRVHVTGDGLFESLTAAAITNLSRLFASISEQIFACFGSIGHELDFYDVALNYVNALSEKKAPWCYPTISADNSVRVTKLYDLYLLLSKENLSNIIPNDFEMTNESEGVAVFGNNGSGKTVYLRSIGTMQLLAQAGLPIPCESATVTLFSQIATQFSEAEKDFCEGNDAGRFEQEVRELAMMVDTLKEGGLVLLNETFQSTAYAEGAEGLYHLLKHFSKLHIRWILVSHLRQLEDLFEPNEVSVKHTSAGYTIDQ